MAVYQFSALADGQAISFNPAIDQLRFDQTTIAAGDLSLVIEGSSLRVNVKSGPVQGKDVLLLNTSLEQIAGSNLTFADGSAALIGDNTTGTANDGGNSALTGGAGRDLLMGLGGNDTLAGSDNNDSLVGGMGNDNLNGGNGNDWLEGGAGNDSLTGSGGQDTFILRESGAANADVLSDFASGWDGIQLDAAAFSAIGATGKFAAGDARFFAGTAAHDADDRIIYNSATGQIFYDADGNGAGAAQLIATLPSGRAVAAGDFTVISGPTPPPPGAINGTSGNDSLVGTEGSDTINGLGGSDTLDGRGGDDTLDGGAGGDQMSGGNGNDTYIADSTFDAIYEPWDDAGIDTVFASVTFDLDFNSHTPVENLTLTGSASNSAFGNSLDNMLVGNDGNNAFNGRGGDDTIFGGGGNDFIGMLTTTSTSGNDVIDGGAGQDGIDYGGGSTRIEVDLAAGTASGGDFYGDNHATLSSIEDVFGGEQGDRLTGNAVSNDLEGRGGDDTLDGAGGIDWLYGNGGADTFVFSAAPGAGNADNLPDFVAGTDKIRLDTAAMANLGATGAMSSGDGRFYAAAGATGGHDADDRIVYNTSTGQLFYDADGSGGAAGQLLATLTTTPALSSTDIVVGVFGTGAVTGTSGDDSIVGGQGADTIDGLAGNDTIDGNFGADLLLGSAGNDSLIGGGGYNDDTLNGGVGNDTLSANGGIANYWFDVAPGTANADVILGSSLYSAKITLDGNIFQNIGPSGNFSDTDERFYAAAGAVGGHDATDRVVFDTTAHALYYDADGNGAGAALLVATFPDFNWESYLRASNIHVVNGDANMVLQGDYTNDSLQGGAGNDSIYGGGGQDTLDGAGGNDLLNGQWGSDVLTGGAGADVFLFSEMPDSWSGAERITDFASGTDKIQLDGNSEYGGFFSTGPAGNFAAGDARFYAAAGATAAHDATDRIIYDTSTGNVYYDDDGTGGDPALLFLTLPAGTTLTATDFSVINGSVDATTTGTSGNDSLTGGNGHDTITGGAGDDTISGGNGNDSLDGEAGNDSLSGGTGTDVLVGGIGNDYLDGGDGADHLLGGEGNDTLTTSIYYDAGTGDTVEGGLGDDTYLIGEKYSGLDTLIDTGGIDTVDTVIDWTLGAGFENLTLRIYDESGPTGTGNELNNVIRSMAGYKGGYRIDGAGGNDTLLGGDNSDTFLFRAGGGNYGNDVIDGGGDADNIAFSTWEGAYATSGATIDLRAGTVSGGMTSGSASFVNVEDATGGDFNDHLIAHDGKTYFDRWGEVTRGANLSGMGGNDTLEAGADNDQLVGGTGADAFVFSAAPGAASADLVTDFATGSDKLWLDARVMTALGASGSFASGDDRFYVAAGASAGHDADDRVVFNTTTGELYYDADGSGSGAAQLIATLAGGDPWNPPVVATLAAQDIVVLNGTAPSGTTLNGTSGNDTLIGGAGNDTINGNAGDDSLVGNGGNDSLDGGSGIDTLDGGFGDDIYVAFANDVLVDAGGIDQINTSEASWTLGASFENLVLNAGTVATTSFGNASNNTITGNGAANTINGMAGNDTLTGGAGADSFVFSHTGNANGDSITDFTSGVDKIHLDASVMTALGASGNLTAGDARFFDGEFAHDADDRIIYNSFNNGFWYDPDGNGSQEMQFIGGVQQDGGQSKLTLAATDFVVDNGTSGGGGGGSTITGTSGNDSLTGTAGNDTLDGLGGVDTMNGQAGNDTYIVTAGDVLSDPSGIDTVQAGVSWALSTGFENLTLTGTGNLNGSGTGSANILTGNNGSNVLRARDGNDTVTGGGGRDFFDFTTPPSATNVDQVTDFVSGTDELEFDDAAFTAIGATGAWAVGDGRFWAAAGATSGHDANDRLVYNSSSGALYYDADGSGAGAAIQVATLQGTATVSATDITVI